MNAKEDAPDLEGITLLIVDDAPASLAAIERHFMQSGGMTYRVCNVQEALGIVSAIHVDVVLAIAHQGHANWRALVEGFKNTNPAGIFYYMGGHHLETPIEVFSAGVEDYLDSDIAPERFVRMVEMRLGRSPGKSTALTLVDPIVSRLRPYFRFRSPAMYRALENLPAMAASNQTILISGQTGTGKEMVARAVHVLSKRADGPFVAVNCGAIPEGLIEDELFGHEKGAFTGALRMRRGKFEEADGGTLLLDEIGDMPLVLQVRLLRVLEDNCFYRVGGDVPVSFNVRIIAATRRELEKAVEEGVFRDDLYYRLNILRIHLPPLSQRPEDIAYLAFFFLARAFTEMNLAPPYPALSAATIDLIERLSWKGNVRELRNVMTRVAILLPPDVKLILPQHVLPHIEEKERPVFHDKTASGIFIPLGTPMRQVEEIVIAETLKAVGGNRSKAARLLKIGLRTLRRRLKE
ncbi:sigma-54 dependent transcriptional regulator [Candidatus Magnetobacterium casense]|uniref:Sigma-54-dependent Fis family transcriptional regulator n=1 Tax=Candidatus Magnetobacterium casense TaxID=1455061 RepID=A0ABS6RTW4_9BACT|nr:sigma-54 dependent transcriptional regulator [Candidatus Magnetobacterium casensis]MBV6340016.1 sigma-54-dependent Fis family transcriptional regulator [Candidatus Magnetobacterium casensis]